MADPRPMTPEEWARLTPEQQAWHYQQWQAYQQRQPQLSYPPAAAAPAAKPTVNVAAIISLAAGLLALLVVPILLGPAALVAGIVGEQVSRKTGGPGNRMSIVGILLGIFATLIALSRLSMLSL